MAGKVPETEIERLRREHAELSAEVASLRVRRDGMDGGGRSAEVDGCR